MQCASKCVCIVLPACLGRKTTQIPQYIYEAAPHSKILICQPRRLAAMGVAQRIAQEACTELGQLIGYMVKGEVKASKHTQILFVTYGVLLRRIQVGDMLHLSVGTVACTDMMCNYNRKIRTS